MVQKKILLVLFFVSALVNANYLMHLKYSNGTVSQEALYYVDSGIEGDSSGGMQLYVNNYSTNISFPLITMYDPEDIFIYGVNRTTADSEIIVVDDEADAYVVIPEAPVGSMVRILNGSDILMDEPLIMPTSFEGNASINGTGNSSCTFDSDCMEGQECKDGGCIPKAPVCGSLFIFLAVASVPLVLKYSSLKTPHGPAG